MVELRRLSFVLMLAVVGGLVAVDDARGAPAQR